jgi:tetratricopeptide (TPR) repeat protein
MRSGVAIAVLTLGAFSLPGFAQDSGNHTTAISPRPSIVLTVNVVYGDNDKPVGDRVRVELRNATGQFIDQELTGSTGQAHFVVPGQYSEYEFVISGDGIDRTTGPRFNLGEGEVLHVEVVRVRREGGPDAPVTTSTHGTVSVASLNIPDKARKEFEQGETALQKDDIAEAEKRLSKAVEVYPKFAAAYNDLGVIAMRGLDTASAEHDFQQAISADDSYAPAYVNLAKMRLDQKKPQDARVLLEKATAAQPLNVEALTLLATTAYALNDNDAVITSAQKVHLLPHQQYAIVHYVAGLAYEKKQQFQQAAAEYQLFLKEAPASPSAAAVQARLNSLANGAQ